MHWRGALLASFLLVPSLAAADVPIEYQTRIEPRFPGVTKLGALAIAPFTGSDGKEFAAAVRAELQAAEVDGRAFYTIRNLDEAAKIDTPASAIKAAQAAGVAAVLYGVVGRAAIDKTDYKQDQAHCAESGILHCSKSETVPVPCTKYAGTYVVTPAVYVVADAKVFYTETVTAQRSFSTCSEAPVLSGFDKIIAKMTEIKHANDIVITTPEGLLTQLRSDAAVAVRTHLTPTMKTIKVTFKDYAPDLDKVNQAQFRSAAAFVRAKRLDRACGIYETISTPETMKNFALLYNLGVCQEALEPDRPAAALVYYTKADQQTKAPDKLVSEALIRMHTQVDAHPAAKR